MAFKARPPGKGISRTKSLQSKTPMKPGAGFAGQSLTTKPPSPAEQRRAQQKALQKATLRFLEKARREAAENGIDLSEWESEFLGSVGERVKTYGRAFADPDKGAAGGTLSLRQGVKLKEIRRKAATARSQLISRKPPE
jgi:hypothetical protein